MKRFIALALMMVIITSMVGCAKPLEKIEENNVAYLEERINDMGFTVLDHVGTSSGYDYYIVYDNETNVVYYWSFTYRSGVSLCPRYDSDGEVMIYKGE